MDLKEFLKSTVRVYITKKGNISEIARPVITCKDGFSLHADAALFRPTYAKIIIEGWGIASLEYETVEITAISGLIDSLKEYQRDCLAAYAFVPVEKVQEAIDAHGGIDEEKTWDDYHKSTPAGVPFFRKYIDVITETKHTYRGIYPLKEAYDGLSEKDS